MSENATHVVVGAGMAGGKAVEALRSQGFTGRIVLLGAEPYRPYQRPPLSKGYLAGSDERESVFVHPESWYAEHDVDLRLGRTAASVDRAAGQILLDDGSTVGFDRLLLATGATPRRPALPGADAAGVHYLRTLDDSDALRATIGASSRLVVIGAGWIGLEVTAAARAAGVEVTIVETAALPLLRVLGPEIAQVFAALHREHGVDLRFGAVTDAITTGPDGRATGVRLDDGTLLEADAVVVAVGAAPNVGLAVNAGLAVSDGIDVDAALATDDPRIFAAGDVANAYHPVLQRRIRVEHWANARNHPAVAAASMLDRPASYTELPYFYTDQYDLGMEYVGYVAPDGYDSVTVRGDLEGREFIAFWLSQGRVLAGMNVNVWDVTDDVKALIGSGRAVDPVALADPDHPLDKLVEPA